MAAQQRVSAEQITAALEIRRGNVKAAAADLAISSNALRARIDRMGVDLAELRQAPAPARPAAPIAPIPIKVKSSRHVPLRVLPSIQDRIRLARFALCARYQVEFADEAILEQFVADAFEPWLRAKLEAES